VSEPRFQHTSEELRAIADLLDSLNRSQEHPNHDISLEGKLDVYWSDLKMGEVRKNYDHYDYYPVAEKRDEVTE
jgi:hypothetical protein